MTILEAQNLERPGDVLAQRLMEPGILGVPGAHHALCGLLAKRAGFRALYLSGAALSASMGLPDLGIITQDELCSAVKSLYRATDLPVIVDGDTGYGEALNVMRLVKDLEEAGAAAIQLEDQMLPKKCGHLSNKRLINAEEMAHKISAAVKARSHLKIVARTDAAAESLQEALRRAQIYQEAGADILFPEALTEAEDFRLFSKELNIPILANMTEFGRTPHRTLSEFESLGVSIVIWPASSLRVAMKTIEKFYADLAETGDARGWLDRMQSRSELYDLIGYQDFEKLDQSILESVLPEKSQ
ncbi:MAG: methylisocitrate lyase [Deltaproteobacteria bacterium]|nr:methylisocitrate lyase [Deltaproteobacteria bacterium]